MLVEVEDPLAGFYQVLEFPDFAGVGVDYAILLSRHCFLVVYFTQIRWIWCSQAMLAWFAGCDALVPIRLRLLSGQSVVLN